MDQRLQNQIERATRLLQQGALTRARQVLESSTPAPAYAHHVLSLAGRIAYARLEIHSALELFSKAAITAPQDSGIPYYLGLCYELLGNRQEAVNQIHRTIESGSPVLIIARSVEFLDSHDLYPGSEREKVVNSYLGPVLRRKAITRDEIVLKVVAYRAMRQFEEAHAVLEGAIRQSDDEFLYWLETARTNFALKKYEDELQAYYKVRELAPFDLSVLPNLAAAQYRCGDYTAASKTLKRVVRRIDTNGRFYHNLGICYTQLTDLVSAIRYFRHATALTPHLAVTNYNRGVTAHRLGLIDEAAESYERSLQVEPNMIPALKNLSLAWIQLKEYAPALETLQRAKEIAGEDEEIKQNIRVASALKLVDPAEKFTARMPEFINIGLIAVSVVILHLILYFLLVNA